MAKVKTQIAKTKKKPTKYTKLLAVAEKELAAKKKSLVQAERSLAKAKRKHEELVSEVARLDMVQRSLKAMVEGTEPPTNIKYVYNYPQWFWYPYPYPYNGTAYPNGGAIWHYTPSITTNTTGLYLNCNTSGGSTAAWTGNTGNASFTSGSSIDGLTGGSGMTTTTGGAITANWASNAVLVPSNAPQAADEVVVDLSTHAEATDASAEPQAASGVDEAFGTKTKD